MSYRFTHRVRSLPVNLLHLDNRSHGSFELLSLGLPTTLLELCLSAILRQISIWFAYAVLSALSTHVVHQHSQYIAYRYACLAIQDNLALCFDIQTMWLMHSRLIVISDAYPCRPRNCNAQSARCALHTNCGLIYYKVLASVGTSG
jgi:hypothetical protein